MQLHIRQWKRELLVRVLMNWTVNTQSDVITIGQIIVFI